MCPGDVPTVTSGTLTAGGFPPSEGWVEASRLDRDSCKGLLMLLVGSALVSLFSGCAPPTALDSAAHDPVVVSRQEQARPADSLVNSIGINVHLSYFQTGYGTNWASVTRPKLIALGVRHLRDAGSVTSDDSWMRLVYGRMAELSAAGMKFNLVMQPALGSSDYTALPQFNRLLQFAAPVVESFEGLNEHDVSGRTAWVSEVRTFQQALYAAVRGDSRTAGLPVLGPAMAHPKNASAVGSLAGWLDFGAIHPYPGGALPMTSIQDHEVRTASISGNRPFMSTETGYHTATAWTGEHPGVSEVAQGHYTPRLLLQFFNAGVNRTYLYELMDEGTNNADREMSFGLLRSDGSEKPAYVALQNLITILKDPGSAFTPGALAYTLGGDSSSVRHTLLQKRDGRFYLILWQDARSFDLQSRSTIVVDHRPAMLNLPSAVTQIRRFTPGTSASAVETLRGTAEFGFEISDTPVILEITP